MSWRLVTHPRVLVAIRGIPVATRRIIGARIDELCANPRPDGSFVRLRPPGMYRTRAGGYDIFYEIDDATRVIRVHDIGARPT